jgi:hypothetical protein
MNIETDQDSNTAEEYNPTSISSKASEDDNLTYEQVMSGPNKEGCWKAAKKEVGTLVKKGAWEVVAKKAWMHVLPSTWAFKCKRFPDGIIRKLKARFCARGDRQIEGLDFFETFAPVVAWETIIIMLIMSIIFDLATLQVDYIAAFVHADIDKPPNWETMTELEKERRGVYIQIPRGFGEAGKVLKLKNSLYGLTQLPRNFFLRHKAKLEKVGFTQSENDPCLFMNDKVICIVYVDDTLFYSPKESYIQEAIETLRKRTRIWKLKVMLLDFWEY